ncbi:Bax inhibitor-1 family protein [Butyrivibrio sp. VCB2006]|uniref:Bax inhibitor-1 family protein n=1 Tax=Butyrivibrio sp. VCB2006 TaxID=1280679 RepID=UPI000419C299|nr:Bax inhibitor-1 family protein [Butyrivibrio sp. VCB2006]
MFGLSERKEERLYKEVLQNEIVSDRTYNMCLGGVIIYGLIVNLIICSKFTNLALSMNPGVFLIGYFICVFAGSYISAKSNDPIVSFLGYNLVVVPIGLVVSTAVYYYGGLRSNVVLLAMVYTAGITIVMICCSILKPEFFSKIGGMLVSGLTGLLIVESVLLILGIEQMITSFIAALIFSLYIGYDYWRAQQYPKTIDNAVDSALDIYLDIINLFLRILRILGSGKSSSKKNSF